MSGIIHPIDTYGTTVAVTVLFLIVLAAWQIGAVNQRRKLQKRISDLESQLETSHMLASMWEEKTRLYQRWLTRSNVTSCGYARRIQRALNCLSPKKHHRVVAILRGEDESK